APAPISSFTKGIPAEIEDLVKRTMAMDPAARPQTMEDFERELNEIAWNCLPAIPNERMVTPRSTASLQGVRGGGGHTVWGPGAMGTVGALWDRLATDRRRLSAVGAAAFVVVSLAVFGISRSRANLDRGNRSMGAETIVGGPSSVPSKWMSQPQMVPVGATEAAPEVKATATAQDALGVNAGAPVVEKGEAAGLGAGESDVEAKASVAASPPRARTAGVVGLSAVDAKKMLTEGEQLLRAQRFAEAREVFTKLIKSKPTRGRALVALAEIAFQEKNYEETIRSAKLAADRGGGARARVLLGDAHFRLSHFQDAATAYGQALQLEPENPSAKSGLALASKRM
ncbi:MAG: tetratricopeptide repeat protein, partial [Deltaproteobacteria bacterium]|nr:tetratricopeptide repeat protein [Deltaproteobacteria bacterium]